MLSKDSYKPNPLRGIVILIGVVTIIIMLAMIKKENTITIYFFKNTVTQIVGRVKVITHSFNTKTAPQLSLSWKKGPSSTSELSPTAPPNISAPSPAAHIQLTMYTKAAINSPSIIIEVSLEDESNSPVQGAYGEIDYNNNKYTLQKTDSLGKTSLILPYIPNTALIIKETYNTLEVSQSLVTQ